MATASQKLPPIPAANVPVVGPNGLVNTAWYAWLKELERVVTIIRTEV